jgi:hypothetical protein
MALSRRCHRARPRVRQTGRCAPLCGLGLPLAAARPAGPGARGGAALAIATAYGVARAPDIRIGAGSRFAARAGAGIRLGLKTVTVLPTCPGHWSGFHLRRHSGGPTGSRPERHSAGQHRHQHVPPAPLRGSQPDDRIKALTIHRDPPFRFTTARILLRACIVPTGGIPACPDAGSDPARIRHGGVSGMRRTGLAARRMTAILF